MGSLGTWACRTEMLKLMVTESTDVPLRAGFDHATSPELVADSFGGWSRLRAEGPAFRSDIAGTYDLWYLLSYADIRAARQDHELFSSRSVQYLGDSPQFGGVGLTGFGKEGGRAGLEEFLQVKSVAIV